MIKKLRMGVSNLVEFVRRLFHKEQNSLSGSGRERQIYLKKEEMLKKMQCYIEREQLRNHCDCLHTSDGRINLKVIRPSTDEMYFECRICGKKIDPVPVNEKMLDEAISTIDKMCDLIKIRLNFREDKDVQVANRIRFSIYYSFIRDEYINRYPLFRTDNSDETDENVKKKLTNQLLFY